MYVIASQANSQFELFRLYIIHVHTHRAEHTQCAMDFVLLNRWQFGKCLQFCLFVCLLLLMLLLFSLLVYITFCVSMNNNNMWSNVQCWMFRNWMPNYFVYCVFVGWAYAAGPIRYSQIVIKPKWHMSPHSSSLAASGGFSALIIYASNGNCLFLIHVQRYIQTETSVSAMVAQMKWKNHNWVCLHRQCESKWRINFQYW